MTPSARLSAAIEVLADIEARRRPASDALKDWGLARRYAGSGDRAAVASLVYDALRRKASAAWVLEADTPRAWVLGALRLARGLESSAVAALCKADRFAPAPLSEMERERLDGAEALLASAPDPVAGDFPEWLAPHLAGALGSELREEMQALSRRAPVDVRVNGLKTDRERLEGALAHLAPERTPISPLGLRFQAGENGRGPSLQVEEAFQKGQFEIQDEGSQVVAMLAGAEPGMQVVDLCAGGGGKTLALAAIMGNKGQIYATDSDARRLAPIHQRLERAGARNVQVRSARGRGDEPLRDLAAQADLVLVDAPCTGTGTWRRNPDAKWRVRPGSLAQRIVEQDAALDRAAALVRPGGRLAYVTCSLLREENDDRIAAALARHGSFQRIPIKDIIVQLTNSIEPAALSSPGGNGLQLTPRRTATDGFFLSVLRRQ